VLTWPPEVAKTKAVMPPAACRLGLAPWSSSHRTTSSAPALAAAIRRVVPAGRLGCFARASTGPAHDFTGPSSPNAAASTTALGTSMGSIRGRDGSERALQRGVAEKTEMVRALISPRRRGACIRERLSQALRDISRASSSAAHFCRSFSNFSHFAITINRFFSGFASQPRLSRERTCIGLSDHEDSEWWQF
jgi:hypothetical protein